MTSSNGDRCEGVETKLFKRSGGKISRDRRLNMAERKDRPSARKRSMHGRIAEKKRKGRTGDDNYVT